MEARHSYMPAFLQQGKGRKAKLSDYNREVETFP